MSTFGPILVGHDGTYESEQACEWSAKLALALDEPLVVGRAFLVGESTSGPESGAALTIEQLDELAQSRGYWGLPPNRVSTAVHSGRPGPALVGLVRGRDAGLLAVGNRRRRVSGAALGRVAQHVTFRSPCPVAVVRTTDSAVTTAPLMVGVDADSPNLEPVMWAMSLACRLGAELHVVSVGAGRSATEATADLIDRLETGESPTMKFHGLIGKPAEELLAHADRYDCSALVIGQRRTHNLGGRLLGQVTAAILRGNDRPTIVSGHD